jgi:calcineurin-like phosphoesterase family protein
MTIYVTADEHYGHHNILRYEDRPFKNMSKMETEISRFHNELVKNNNHVIHAGDFIPFLGPERKNYFRSIMKKYEGHGIHHLVVGNHDEAPFEFYLNIGFTSVHTAMWFNYKGFRFVIVHDPAKYIAIPKKENQIILCGHVHSLFTIVKNVVNVGVDVWDYKPVSLDKIIQFFKGV